MMRSPAAVASAFALTLAAPAHAVLLNHGLTYTLTEAPTANPLIDEFVLSITGINAASDDEGGRSGVNALAFEKPPNLVTAAMISPPLGYTYALGGLDSSGCNGSGNFFCFDNPAIPPTPGSPYAPGSSLSFTFDVTTSAAGSFAGYDPHFKIDWVGSQNNYDLVSLAIGVTDAPPTNVPEPASLLLLSTGLLGSGILFRRRRRG